MTLLDDVDALEGSDLFDHGLENPCPFWSRGMFPDTAGYAPCYVRIRDNKAFAMACVDQNVEPLDYLTEHIEDAWLGEPLPFRLACDCPGCIEQQGEDESDELELELELLEPHDAGEVVEVNPDTLLDDILGDLLLDEI